MKFAKFFLALAFAVAGCGPDQVGRGGTASGTTGRGGRDLGEADLSLTSLPDFSGVGNGQADACAAVQAMATLVKRPVDIIFVIDTSGSMTEEIDGVEKNIAVNFANIIGMSGLDYRVIMIGEFGVGSLSVCIKPPLGNNTCTTETKPVFTSNFYHYNTFVNSNDSFKKILDTFATNDTSMQAPMGWSAWLRKDALKVFVEVTDDMPNTHTAATFDQQLLAKPGMQFGTAAARDYIFHSIVGIESNSPATNAWMANQLPVSTAESDHCSTAYNAGIEYQKLTKTTGGVAYPVCNYMNYDAVFKTIAQGVIEGAKVACQFDIPPAPNPLQKVDLESVVVNYLPSGASGPTSYTKVDSLSVCTTAGNFYIEADPDGGTGKIVLCPDACTQVQSDDMAQVGVTFSCLSDIS